MVLTQHFLKMSYLQSAGAVVFTMILTHQKMVYKADFKFNIKKLLKV